MIGPTRRSTKGGWTEEEDKTLANAVQKYNGKNWKKIAECIPDRTDVQCLHRWQKVLNPELVKGPWTKEEDDQIIEMVGKWGNKKWSEIAKYLPGRIGKQCRERWHNHLNPDIKKTAWTKEEELILIKAHNIYGNKWAEIAKILHGRTENSIKNHWNCSIRKKLEYSSQTGGGSRNPEEVKQTLDLRVISERSFNLCSLDLDHGAPTSRESHLQSSVEDVLEKRGDIMTKSPSTNISHERDVDSCLPNSSRCQRTAENIAMLGESHDMNANLPNKLCSSSSSDVAKFGVFYGIQTRKPGDGIDLLPSRSLSGPLQACLSTPMYSKPSFAVTTDKRLFKPSSDQQGNTSSVIDFGQSNSKLIGQLDNSVSTTMKYEGRNHAGACENLGNRGLGLLCYKPLQQEDMNIFLETGKFPSTDSYIQAASSSISCCTDSSTDSIVTSLSSQFENTPSLYSQFENIPSIIRKRRVFDRQSGNANHRKDIDSHKESLNNDQQFRHPHPYSEYAVSSKLQLKSQKHGTSSAIKSVEKRLEHVFDVEWNTTRAISRTSNADSI